jgi:hypothetical protein
MAKMAENCGGRYRARTCDLLGVNERDSAQIRQLAQTVRRGFRSKGPFRSVSVPAHGTDCTKDDLLIAEELERVFADFSPGPTNYRKPPAGHIVYFVGGEAGPVKIGFTQQPMKARLVCIQNGSPVKLHVLATTPGFKQLERIYHKQFAAYRLHGEWFERSPELLAEIERLNANG